MEYLKSKKKLIHEIKNTVKKDKVICALSGGVDSSVVALLINKTIKKKNLICIMVDTGLMRKNEFKYNFKIFKNKYNFNVRLIDASNIFLRMDSKICQTQKTKRKIIGNLFIKIFLKRVKKV